jgi:hypothetical protein
MTLQDLFSGYDKFTTAAELAASRGHSFHASRITTTPTAVSLPGDSRADLEARGEAN